MKDNRVGEILKKFAWALLAAGLVIGLVSGFYGNRESFNLIVSLTIWIVTGLLGLLVLGVGEGIRLLQIQVSLMKDIRKRIDVYLRNNAANKPKDE